MKTIDGYAVIWMLWTTLGVDAQDPQHLDNSAS